MAVRYCFTTKTEDVTKAYPYLIAKEVSADPWYVCWSGGGIISRWIPPETELPLTDILMPELFETGKDLDFVHWFNLNQSRNE